MSLSNAEDSELQFSVIDKKSRHGNSFGLEVETLLHQNICALASRQPCSSPKAPPSYVAATHETQNGSFIKDLQRVQKELSFDESLYDVFASEAKDSFTYQSAKSKQLEPLRTTKQTNNSELKSSLINDYEYLIINFSKQGSKKQPNACPSTRKSVRSQNLVEDTSVQRPSVKANALKQNPSISRSKSPVTVVPLAGEPRKSSKSIRSSSRKSVLPKKSVKPDDRKSSKSKGKQVAEGARPTVYSKVSDIRSEYYGQNTKMTILSPVNSKASNVPAHLKSLHQTKRATDKSKSKF